MPLEHALRTASALVLLDLLPAVSLHTTVIIFTVVVNAQPTPYSHRRSAAAAALDFAYPPAEPHSLPSTLASRPP
jgi:hypothetical protein